MKLQVAKPKLSGIEVARGIAATMVVFYHAARHLKTDYGVMPWAGIAQFGHAGVDFFFVLSGFIIFFSHQKDVGHPLRLFAYFERRFTRIYPLFWVSLIIGVALTLLSSTQKLPSFFTLLLHSTLLPFGGDVGVSWTLQHEILFYFIFAFSMINRQLGIAVFMLWFGFIIGAWMTGYVPTDSSVLIRLVSTFNLEFFFGILAAYIVKNCKVIKTHLILASGIASFCSFALSENIGAFNGYTSPAQLAYGISSMLVVIGVGSANLNGSLVAPKFLTEIGTASYSIYLLHLPCIGVIYKVLAVTGTLAHIPLGLLYALLTTSAIATCMVFSRLVEYPLMNLVRKIISRKLLYLKGSAHSVAR